jgi:signal transduction histidine kinase
MTQQLHSTFPANIRSIKPGESLRELREALRQDRERPQLVVVDGFDRKPLAIAEVRELMSVIEIGRRKSAGQSFCQLVILGTDREVISRAEASRRASPLGTRESPEIIAGIDRHGQISYTTHPRWQAAVDELTATWWGFMASKSSPDESSQLPERLAQENPLLINSSDGRLQPWDLSQLITVSSEMGERSLYFEMLERNLKRGEEPNGGESVLFQRCHLELPDGRHGSVFYDLNPILEDSTQVDRIAAILAARIAEQVRSQNERTSKVVVVGFPHSTQLLCRQVTALLVEAFLGRSISFENRVLERFHATKLWRERLQGIGECLLVPILDVQSTYYTAREIASLSLERSEWRLTDAYCILWVDNQADTGPPGYIPVSLETEHGRSLLTTLRGQNIRLNYFTSVQSLAYTISSCPLCREKPQRSPLTLIEVPELILGSGDELPPDHRQVKLTKALGQRLDNQLWSLLTELPGTLVPQPRPDMRYPRRYHAEFGRFAKKLAEQRPHLFTELAGRLPESARAASCLVCESDLTALVLAQSLQEHLSMSGSLFSVDLGQHDVNNEYVKLPRWPQLKGKQVLLVIGFLSRPEQVRDLVDVVHSSGGEIVVATCLIISPFVPLMTAVRGALGEKVELHSLFLLDLPSGCRKAQDEETVRRETLEKMLDRVRWPPLRKAIEARIEETDVQTKDYLKGIDLARLSAKLYEIGESADPGDLAEDRTLFCGPRNEGSLRGSLLRRALCIKAFLEHPFDTITWARAKVFRYLEQELQRFKVLGGRLKLKEPLTDRLIDIAEESLKPKDRDAAMRLLMTIIEHLGRFHATSLLRIENVSLMVRIAAFLDQPTPPKGLHSASNFFMAVVIALKRAAARLEHSLTLEQTLDTLLAYESDGQGLPQEPRCLAWLHRLYLENTSALQIAVSSRQRLEQRYVKEFFRVRSADEWELEQFQSMIRALRALRDELGHNPNLNKALEYLCSATDADAALIYIRLTHAKDVPLQVVERYGLESGQGPDIGDTLPAGSTPLRAYAESSNIIEHEPADDPLAEALEMSSMICLPVYFSEEKPRGVTVLLKKASNERRRFFACDLRAASFYRPRICELIESTYEAGTLEKNVETAKRDALNYVVEIVNAKSASLLERFGKDDIEKNKKTAVGLVIERVLQGWDEKGKLTTAPLATIWYYDQRRQVIIPRATYGYDINRLKPQVLELDDSLLGSYTRELESSPKAKLFYCRDFMDSELFRHKQVPDFRENDITDLLTISMLTTDGRRLYGFITLYLARSSRLSDDKRTTLEAPLRSFSLQLSTLLEQSMFKDCLQAIKSMLSCLRQEVSYRFEEGCFNDVTESIAENLEMRECCVFYAEDGKNFALVGTTYEVKQRDLSRWRFAGTKWPGWADEESCRLTYGWSKDRAQNEEWPQAIIELLDEMGAKGESVLLHLVKETEGTTKESVVAAVIGVGRRVFGSEERTTRFLTTGEARKVKAIEQVIVWAVRSRLDIIGKDRFVAMSKHGLGGAIHMGLIDIEAVKSRLEREKYSAASNALDSLKLHFKRLQLSHHAADIYLSIVRKEQYRLSEPRTKVSLSRLIYEAMSLCYEEAQYRKGVKIKFTRSRTQINISARRESALLAFFNVIDNAVKYSFYNQTNGIRIKASESSGNALIRIIDYGVEIPPSFLERIFEPFVRAEVEDPVYKRPGMGIGLYLVNAVVKAHGGTVHATVRKIAKDCHKVMFEILWPLH